jgi:hypothetical protein
MVDHNCLDMDCGSGGLFPPASPVTAAELLEQSALMNKMANSKITVFFINPPKWYLLPFFHSVLVEKDTLYIA